MIIDNHKKFRHRLSIDYQYQSINWYRLPSIVHVLITSKANTKMEVRKQSESCVPRRSPIRVSLQHMLLKRNEFLPAWPSLSFLPSNPCLFRWIISQTDHLLLVGAVVDWNLSNDLLLLLGCLCGPVINSVFGRQCRKTVSRGREDTRVWYQETMFSQTVSCDFLLHEPLHGYFLYLVSAPPEKPTRHCEPEEGY